MCMGDPTLFTTRLAFASAGERRRLVDGFLVSRNCHAPAGRPRSPATRARLRKLSMGVQPIFDPTVWSRVPFHFWSLVLFVLGCIVGSFLNVCIHRLPLGQSIVSPPSHCPHCKYSIPWYLNIPLVTWLYLRGQCN